MSERARKVYLSDRVYASYVHNSPGEVMPTLRCQQVEFTRGQEHMVAWVDVAWDLKPGMQVTGTDGAHWTVSTVYETVVEYHHLNRKWEMGGL